MAPIYNSAPSCNSASLADYQAQLDAFYSDPEVAVRAGTGADAMPLKPGGRVPEYDEILEWLRSRRPVPEHPDPRSLQLLLLVRKAIAAGSPSLARLVVHMVSPGYYPPELIATASWGQLLDMLEAAVDILILRAEQGAKEEVLTGQSPGPVIAAPVVDRRRQIRQSRPFFSTTGPPPANDRDGGVA